MGTNSPRAVLVIGLACALARAFGSTDKYPATKQVVVDLQAYNQGYNPQYYQSPYYEPQYYRSRVAPPVIYVRDTRFAPVSWRRTGSNTNTAALLYVLLGMRDNGGDDATASPITVDPGTCIWGEWGTCSKSCGGIQIRYRRCAGVLYDQQEDCNPPEVGFEGNWYRASNCLEYNLLTDNTNYGAAVTACSGINARVASTGIRDLAVRTEVMSAFVTELGVDAINDPWVGVTDTDRPGYFMWTDGYFGPPTGWHISEPGNEDDTCHRIRVDTFALSDNSCAGSKHALCERVVQE